MRASPAFTLLGADLLTHAELQVDETRGWQTSDVPQRDRSDEAAEAVNGLRCRVGRQQRADQYTTGDVVAAIAHPHGVQQGAARLHHGLVSAVFDQQYGAAGDG